MSGFKTLRHLAALAMLLPLGACYVAPGAIAPFGPAEPSGTAYAPPLESGFTSYPPGNYQPPGSGYAGTTCSAGNYVCQVPPGPLGAQCSCPGLGAPSFGVIR